MPHRVKLNRSERRPPFLSNLVKGDQEQVTPNGVAYNGDRKEPSAAGAIVGAESAPIPWASDDWGPNSNRSGE